MNKISKVYKGVYFTDSLENYLNKELVSLCQFLFFLDIADIAQFVQDNFYTDKTWHFKYNVEAMIKLVAIKFETFYYFLISSTLKFNNEC